MNANDRTNAKAAAAAIEDVRRLTILLCPNAFKGSLTAPEAARAMSEGVARIRSVQANGTRWELETRSVPLADGGDGTLETLVSATGGTLTAEQVTGPLGTPVMAQWGRLGGAQSDTAIIEMAQASGLRLLTAEQRDPLHATTFGVGQLMRRAVEAGCRHLLVGIGGSATNDGGAGMAQALGAYLLDADGRELPFGGASLRRLAHIDLRGFLLPPDVRVTVACDVDNPLCGAEGAAFVYGPQKGATPEQAAELDAALSHFGRVLHSQLGADVAERPGAGAAGGLGAGLMAFCDAELRSGIDMVMEATGFEAALDQAALVLTGEGRLDSQTGRGKVIAGVIKRAKAAGVPVIALAGALEEGAEDALRPEGLTAALCILSGPLAVEEAMQQSYRLLAGAAERSVRLLEVWLRAARDLTDAA